MDLPLKQWSEDDVQIDVTHCGICGSDDHMLSESWGPTNYPVCVGKWIAIPRRFDMNTDFIH